MKTIWRILCAMLFVAGFLHPFPTHGTSVGVSPASVRVTVLQGTTREIRFNLSRSDAIGGQMVFSGEIEGDQILRISQNAPIVIPPDTTDGSAFLIIDAQQAEIGTYESTVRLVQAPDFIDAGSVKILTGVGVSVRVDVVSRADYLTYLHDSVFGDIHLDVPGDIQVRSTATINASVRSNDSIALDGFTYQYLVTNAQGETMQEERVGKRLEPYEVETQNVPFSFSKEGTYTAELRVLYGSDIVAQVQKAFIVLSSDPLDWLPVITAGALLLFGGWSIASCYRKKG